MPLFLSHKIAVVAISAAKAEEAKTLAEQLNLTFLNGPTEKAVFEYDYLLLVTDTYLALHKTSDKKFSNAFYIDFLSKKMQYRYRQAGLRNELLARAIGIHPREQPIILDATAGLGRDGFILAALGFHVTMLERSPLLYVLLRDALARAKKDASLAAVIERMHLYCEDAYLRLKKHLSPTPDIIYLDPMFPPRQKTAAVKKEISILQELLGESEDIDPLFEIALTCAKRRVVVKRPRLVGNTMDITPSFSLKGKSSRFDVYLVNNKDNDEP